MQTSCWFLGNGNDFTALIFNVYFFNMGSTNLVYLKFWSPVAIYYQRPSWSLIVDWESVTAKMAGSSEREEKEYLINCVALDKK